MQKQPRFRCLKLNSKYSLPFSLQPFLFEVSRKKESMAFELDTLSYTLLATIVGTAALLSARNSKTSDIHPLLLNTQSDVSRLRYPGESAIYRSRMYPTSTPLCSTFERSIRTLADFYKAGGIKKHSNTEFLKQDNGYVSLIIF